MNSTGMEIYPADPMRPYDELVGVVSQQELGGMKLVEPGDAANSYIMIKLGRYDQTKLQEDLMPDGQNDEFCSQKIDAIDRWIAAGATAD